MNTCVRWLVSGTSVDGRIAEMFTFIVEVTLISKTDGNRL